MRILVTGATSSLGVAFCRTARGADIDVLSGVRTTTNGEKTSGSGDEVCLRLEDQTSFKNIPRGVDAIVHIAAANTGTSEHLTVVNGDGTRLLIEAAKTLEIGKIIHISSMSVYGTVTDRIVRADTPIRHSTSYGSSKRAAECYLNAAWPHVKAVSIRSPAIIGPDARRNFLATLRDMMEKQVPTVELKNPDFLFNNLIHTESFSEFLVVLLRQGLETYSAFPIAAINSIPLKDVVKEVARACAYAGKITWVSGGAVPFSIDSSFATRLGYKPWTVEKSLTHWLAR